ncbi:MAG: response regulator [Maricaulaceae bacterium]
MDDGWIVIAAFLVFLMQAGFLLIEAGSVRAKNSINAAQKNVSNLIICLACYSLIGFGLMYGSSYGGYIGVGRVKDALQDQTRLPELLIFNLALCSIAATIVSGAIAERMKISAYLISTAIIALFVYPIFGHWAWGSTIITSNVAFLANMGFVDHAGGVVIHTLGAFYAFAAVLTLGPRQGRFDENGKVNPISGSSPVLALSGALILFVMWIPFNTGSLTPGSQLFSEAALVTILGGSAGGVAGKLIGYILQNKTFSPEASFNGILGGLVAVTCGTLFIGPIGAVTLGFLGGTMAILGNYVLLHNLKIDDPVGVIGVHGFAGAVGSILFPIFAVKSLPAGNMLSQIMTQSLGVFLCIAWAMIFGVAVFAVLKVLKLLRVSDAQEHLGLNIGEHTPDLSKEHLEAGYQASTQSRTQQSQIKALTGNNHARSEIGLALSTMVGENQRLGEEAQIRSTMFTEAVDSLSDGLMIFDSDQVVTEVNSAYRRIMASINVDCYVGMTRRDYMRALLKTGILSPGDTPVEEFIDNYLTSERVTTSIQGEVTIGDSHYIRRARFIPSGGQIVVLTDVTDMKEALHKSKLAEKAKAEFLANMSHEIRTPMNGIIGMTELLSRTELDPRQQSFVETIANSGSALMTIINDILDFSKIEAGKVKLNPVPFVIRDSIEDVTTMLANSASEKNLELMVRMKPNLPETYIGDVGRFRQIMTNLIGNALKFTHFGHVFIDVDGTKNNENVDLIIRIEDTGIGIPADQIEHVFKKFSQADGTTTREYEGTGLGLSITSNLIELMGGTISVESVLGKGTVFTINLTLPSHRNLKPVKKVPVEIIGANILIVDDNLVNRNILREQTKYWKCRNAAVESAAKALQVLENAQEKGIKIDLIITDYQMPGMNGDDFFKTLQMNANFADIPVIMLTSVSEDRLIQKLQEDGISAVLTKPVRSSMLLNTIAQSLFKSQANADDIVEANTNPLASVAEALPSPRRHVARDIERRMKPRNEALTQRGLDVLVAEDNVTNQVYIKYIMEELNLSFKIVPNGRAAVDYWRSENPTIILMDISMPDMNGYEATKIIREDEQKFNLDKTPIIAVTAHTLSGDEEKCLAAGMDDYLSKPVSIVGLKSKLAQWGNTTVFKNVAD